MVSPYCFDAILQISRKGVNARLRNIDADCKKLAVLGFYIDPRIHITDSNLTNVEVREILKKVVFSHKKRSVLQILGPPQIFLELRIYLCPERTVRTPIALPNELSPRIPQFV
jgi:hypothetical protein